MLKNKLKIYKYFAPVLILGPTLSMISCNSKEEKGTIIVAVVSDSYNYSKAISSFAVKAIENRGYNAQVIVTNEDPTLEQNKIKQIISSKDVKGVVLVPAKKDASAVIIKKLNQENIPVVIIDRNIDSSNGATVDGSILTDNAGAAKQIVKYAKDNYASDIDKIYIANGEAGGDSAIDRKKGFDEGIQEYFPSIKVNQTYKVDTPGWALNTAQTQFSTLASGFYASIAAGKKGLILSAAIPMTNGIVGSGGFDKSKSIVLGFDIDKQNTANLTNGKIIAAGMQRPDIMSTWAVAKLNMKIMKHSAEQEREKYYTNKEFQRLAPLSNKITRLPITIITKDTISKIVYG